MGEHQFAAAFEILRRQLNGFAGQSKLQSRFTLNHGATYRPMLRAESINLSNTPQFAEPGLSLTDPNFGVITNTLNDGRAFRFVLRLGF